MGQESSRYKPWLKLRKEKNKGQPPRVPARTASTYNTAEEGTAPSESLTLSEVWYRHTGEPIINEIPSQNTNQYWTVEGEAAIIAHIGQHHITHLAVKKSLPHFYNTGQHVAHLQISDLQNISQLNRLSAFGQLTTLILNNICFANGLPAVVGELKTLSKIELSSCILSDLPPGFSRLQKLKILDLSNNCFYKELPSAVCELKSLEELDLSYCQLSELPTKMSQLKRLTKLNLSDNEFPGTLPPVIGELKSLLVLNLRNCQLSDLPSELSSLTKLEELNLSSNDFYSGLPTIVVEIKSLAMLWLGSNEFADDQGNGLKTLPEKFCQLKKLRHLDLSHNRFAELPTPIYTLTQLRVLNLRNNKELIRIEKGLQQLAHLEKLDLNGCLSQMYPPEPVCRQGVSAVKQYFKDLEKDKAPKLSSVPLAVIGASLSGKTSLIRSLKAMERRLTFRDKTSAKDETTKVFEVQEHQFKDFAVKFIDYGGQEIYHLAYSVAKKDLCLPIVVVNMKEFHLKSRTMEAYEATKKVLFDWLSHLYIACPRLGRPILVLTHIDQLAPNIFQVCRNALLTATETIRHNILKEENQLSKASPGVLRHIDHFRQTDQPFIHSDDIFEFSNDLYESENIYRLNKQIQERCRPFASMIPKQWDAVENFFHKDEAFYTEVSDVRSASFQIENLDVVLRYFHNSGSILWFENLPQLSNYVFHNIPAIVNMIAVLFHHSIEDQWESRKQNYSAFVHNNKVIDIAKYTDLIKQFTRNGMLAEALLVHLMEECKFPTNIAISLLSSFHVICGPLEEQLTNYYIVPYFATNQMTEDWKTSDCLKLRMKLCFRGLTPPKYIFHQVTVAVLDCTASPVAVTKVYQQGATVRIGERIIHLIHDYLSSVVTLQVSTTPEELGKSWVQLLRTCDAVHKLLQSAWPACRAEVLMYCAHCLYIEDPNPSCTANPDWLYHQGVIDFSEIQPFFGVDKVACKRCQRKDEELVPAVPCPLVFPCYELTEKEIAVVRSFLAASPKVQQCVVPLPISNSEDSDSELSDSLEYLDETDEHVDIINLPLKPTTRPDIINRFTSNTVYKMSSPIRGRCLIINNQNFDMPTAANQTCLVNRPGSQMDAYNLQAVFTSLSFECTVKSDISGQEMLNIIKEEVKHPQHRSYGMFILVVMSHGSETSISGSDGRSVKLSKIYDLMSPYNFKAMKDRPKWIIIQACSGDRRDTMESNLDTDVLQPSSNTPHTSRSPPRLRPRPRQRQNVGHGTPPLPARRRQCTPLNAANRAPSPPPRRRQSLYQYLSTDDMFVMRASFPSYVSLRHKRNGSWFIRALVESLYKHACHRDIETLFQEQVRKKVRHKSIAFHRKHGGTGGQQPIMFSTPTRRRKLFLFPGHNS